MPIYNGKGDVTNCKAYTGVKLLEHGTKIIERILEGRIRALVEVDNMQFGFMPKRGTIDAFFIVRRKQQEYRKKDKKLYMYFMDFEKAFDRVPRRGMQWALRKKGLPKIWVKVMMSLYVGSKTKVKVGSEFLKEFFVAIGVHQGVVSSLLFAIVVDVMTANAKGLMKEVLYAGDVLYATDE